MTERPIIIDVTITEEGARRELEPFRETIEDAQKAVREAHRVAAGIDEIGAR